jgi:hypothetical protein
MIFKRKKLLEVIALGLSTSAAALMSGLADFTRARGANDQPAQRSVGADGTRAVRPKPDSKDGRVLGATRKKGPPWRDCPLQPGRRLSGPSARERPDRRRGSG